MTLFIKSGHANENLCLLILPFKNKNKYTTNHYASKFLCIWNITGLTHLAVKTEKSNVSFFVHWKNRHEQYIVHTIINPLSHEKKQMITRWFWVRKCIKAIIYFVNFVFYSFCSTKFVVKRNIIFYNVIEPNAPPKSDSTWISLAIW